MIPPLPITLAPELAGSGLGHSGVLALVTVGYDRELPQPSQPVKAICSYHATVQQGEHPHRIALKPELPWLISAIHKYLTAFGLGSVAIAGLVTMGVFPKKKYVSSSESNTIAARYRAALAKRPFLLFGLPFISIIVAGSFVLTPATAIRYEKHDRKVRQMTKEEELGVGRQGRKVDIRDEYYRLAAKDLDDWEQKRVKRLPGESDGVL